MTFAAVASWIGPIAAGPVALPIALPIALIEAVLIVLALALIGLLYRQSQNSRALLDRQALILAALEEQSMHIRHEFLNGAARMGIYVRRIEDGGEPLSTVTATAIAAIERERSALVASTEAILRLSRVRTGERQTREEDLARLAGEVVDMLEARAEEKEIRVAITLAKAPVLGDPGMLAMMLSNIVGNAIKYTPPGGQVLVATHTEAESAWVVVEDSGPGIAAELREQVFQPRLRIESTAEEPGHGYGLAIAMAVAVQHRGTIRIDDGQLGGARFVVHMPAYDGDR